MQRIKLENLSHMPPFDAPAGYFDDLPMRVQAKIAAQKAPEERLRLSWSWRRTAVWVTAICVIGALIWVTYPQKQYSLGEETLSQVSDEVIVGYLKESNVSQQDLAEQIPATDAYRNEEALLEQLNIDEEALQNALQEEDHIEEII
ncbi:MAG: hypothetical protein EAZ80_12980 [Runella slithyformis]|nr:MAG: hypothetical protein EAZ80_12980 [Runella slithyformis]